MKLMSVKEYQQTQFTKDSQPRIRQIIRWINAGFIRGRKCGRQYFVNIEVDSKLTGNPMLDKVLTQTEENP